mmetsp:Transcript_10389/g.27604  ORF Transcript_10389/g.27604 Transcript_10389/m.27604 type:complete len:213 (+) Transcript_10389:115-753(+)
MCTQALPNARLTAPPVSHGRLPRPPTRKHPTCEQTRCLGPLPAHQTATHGRNGEPNSQRRRHGNGRSEPTAVTAVVPAVMTSVVAVSMDGGHALARVVALAAQQGSPSPPAKARPIHKEGRTVHSPVHALSAPATPLDHAKIEIASPTLPRQVRTQESGLMTTSHEEPSQTDAGAGEDEVKLLSRRSILSAAGQPGWRSKPRSLTRRWRGCA